MSTTRKRFSGITSEYWNGSRPALLKRAATSMDLNAIIRELEKIFSSIFGQEMVLHTQLDPELKRIHGDAREIQLILVSLLMRARDVGSPRGEVLLSTANLEVDGLAAAELSLTPGKYVRLDVLLNDWIETESIRESVHKLHGALTTTTAPERGVTITLALPQAN